MKQTITANSRLGHRRYEPLYILEDLYERIEPRFPFTAENSSQWTRWRRQFRKELAKLLGFEVLSKYLRTAVLAKRLDRTDCGDYIRELWEIKTFPKGAALSFVLIPQNADRPLPAIVAAHGHGDGVNMLLQLKPNGAKHKEPYSGIHHDYALQAVREGFVVLAPEIADFGRRRNFSWLDRYAIAGSCYPTETSGIQMGVPAIGLRTWEMMRQLDWFVTHPAVIADRIGMLGLSGGGMLTTYTSIFEDRIRAGSICAYLTRFGMNMLKMLHCSCSFVPGQLLLGENDDVTSLIAPKPLLLECSRTDTTFPIKASRLAIRKLRRVYGLLEKKQNLVIDIFDGVKKWGGHEFHGEKTWSFFRRHLLK